MEAMNIKSVRGLVLVRLFLMYLMGLKNYK